MIKKLITLFKLGRKIAKSDILKIASKFKKPPLAVTILFQILSISFEKKEQNNLIEDDGERLSRSLESMGTTFIKLGQFLATRPDIIGEKEPYEYLIKSIEQFINQDELIELMEKNNFHKCSYRNLSGGIVSIHSGWKI